jgi:shikimate kinase
MDSNPNHSPPRCLVLIGFMGCGKSSIGRKLHEQLGYQFIDTDQCIEQRRKQSIPQIFAKDGEEAFRDLESSLLQELADSPPDNRIISTGGGIVLREANRKLLRELGFVVWLKASAEEILNRTSRNSNRPLLQTEDPKAAITEMMVQRSPLYKEAAHLELDTGNLDIEETCAGILECASYHFTKGP